MVLILLGLGLDEFSASPVAIPEIKKIIRSITLEEAKKIAKEAFKLPSGEKIKKFVEDKIKKIAPELRKQKE